MNNNANNSSQNSGSGSVLGQLGSSLGQMDPSTIRSLMMATALVAPMYASPIEGALGSALPAAEGEQQMNSLQNLYNSSSVSKGGLGGLLSQLGGSLFGGMLNPNAHAYLMARASTANSIANATGQDPNAVLAGLPGFQSSPQAAQGMFQNVQAPLGQNFSGGILGNLPAPSMTTQPNPGVQQAY